MRQCSTVRPGPGPLPLALTPALDPASRLSSRRQPELDSPVARAPHVIVIDDVLCFQQMPKPGGAPKGVGLHSKLSALHAEPPAGVDAPQPHFPRVLSRYADVNIRTKPSKVHDYASTQVGIGVLLDDNDFRTPPEPYVKIHCDVQGLKRRGWARPREVERLVGRFTSSMLLLRLTLSIYDAVYAFAWKVGDRHARLWPAVVAELEHACALLPLMRADACRRTAPLLVQSDACNDGDAVVYTEHVPHSDLRREALRPRSRLRDSSEAWTVEQALACGFTAPIEPECFSVAVRYEYPIGSASRERHINAKELGAVEKVAR